MDRRSFGRAVAGIAAGLLVDPRAARAAARAVVPPTVDGERLLGHLRGLAAHGATPAGGVTRVAYSEADLAGREYVAGLMREAGLAVEVDAAGNLIGRRGGSEPGLKPIAFGSHIDSVPDGGRFDGPVGALAAVEVAHTLADEGITTRHPLEVIIFSNEEGGLIGSRALSGELPGRELDLESRSGKTIREGIGFIGGDADRLASVRRERGDIAAFLEVHIEQGGTLEAEGVDIGVVEGIVGIRWWDAVWQGVANHAGTTPMHLRHDALLSASRFVQAVNEVIRGEPGAQVGTVGRIAAEPGAPNVIPGRVVASLEIRDLDAARIDRLFAAIRERAEAIADEDGTSVSFEEVITLAPAPSDDRVRAAIAAAAGDLGLSTRSMPSGAGHDAQSMARLGPIGMIFVPSVGGISHSPRELTRDRDVVNGANVLLGAVMGVDAEME